MSGWIILEIHFKSKQPLLTFSSHGSFRTDADGSSGSLIKFVRGCLRFSLRRRLMSPAAMKTGSLRS